MTYTLYSVEFSGKPVEQTVYTDKQEALTAFDALQPFYGPHNPSKLELALYDDCTDDLIRSTHPDYQRIDS